MKSSEKDLDEITIAQLLRAIKPAHLVIFAGILFSLIGGAFSLGINWEKHRFDIEVMPLNKLVDELKGKNSTLKRQVSFYREKDKFISLTSTLQFQASIRGVEHHKLFTCSNHRQELSDDQVKDIYKEYSDTMDAITNSQNGKEPIAFLGPISRACTPRLISFQRDESAAYLVNDFIPNK